MRKLIPSLIIAALIWQCDSSTSVSEKYTGDSSATNADKVKEFSGTAGSFEYTGCDTSAYPDLSVAPDIDKDGIIDICDNFIIERPDGSFLEADQGYYFGYKVWGSAALNPTHSAEASFVIHNMQTAALTVSASIVGTNASNFIIKEGITASLPSGGAYDNKCDSGGTNCDKFTLKIQATDTNMKSASLKITVNGKDFFLAISGNTLVCNGNSLYCERRFNQVAYASTHNAHTNEDDFDGAFSFIGINQENGFQQQMNDGIRGLMIDWYEDSGRIRNCHGDCVWGWSEAVNKNIVVSNFLYSHPGEVMHYMIEEKINSGNAQYAANKVTETLTNGGLMVYVFDFTDAKYQARYNTPNVGNNGGPGSQWPHLGWMVENDKRLVVFTDNDNASSTNAALNPRPTYLYGWNFQYYPGSYDNTQGKMSCKGRTIADPAAHRNFFYILSIWETCDPTSGSTLFCNFGGGIKSSASKFNSNSSNGGWPGLTTFATSCWNNQSTYNKSGEGSYNPNKLMPVSLAVDFYNKGGGLNQAALNLNNAWPAYCVANPTSAACD